MDIIDLGTRREVCWDEYLMDTVDGVTVAMHRPEYRGVAMQCDAPWEGNVCGYFHTVEDSRRVRLYYRAADLNYSADGPLKNDTRDPKNTMPGICYAESADGKTFTRPDLSLVERFGSVHNNILVDEALDNFTVFKDMNPDCPKEAIYKALAGNDDRELVLYTSPDGIRFTRVGVLLSDGAYDSLNLCFWDETRQKYFLYYRGLHVEGTEDSFRWEHSPQPPEGKEVIRDVRVRTSSDFIHWDEPKLIRFGEDQDDYQLYTNHIRPYYRAPHVFLGMPTRYVERLEDRKNFRHLPDRKRRADITRAEGRSGYAMTDCVLMTSRDGEHFRRTDEAFMTPGPEHTGNWYYGDCYPAWGMVETESDRPGLPHEISLYCGDYYRALPVQLDRWAVRVDGFFSWHGDYKGGTVLTKPFTFGGPDLTVNFATSALGHVRLTLCDEEGTPLPGFDSGRLFGDSLDRPVEFDGDLKTLLGRPVRLKAELRDADLYSFRFNTEDPLA